MEVSATSLLYLETAESQSSCIPKLLRTPQGTECRAEAALLVSTSQCTPRSPDTGKHASAAHPPMAKRASLGTLFTALGSTSKMPVVPTVSSAPVASTWASAASASSAPANPASFLQSHSYDNLPCFYDCLFKGLYDDQSISNSVHHSQTR